MSLQTKIKKIISAIKDSNIGEIEITNFWGAQKIRLKTKNDIVVDNNDIKNKAVVGDENVDKKVASEIIQPVSGKSSNEEIDTLDKNIESVNDVSFTEISAPLVGTFYQSSKPGEKPFVEIGSKVSIGDPLCIIEAMKIFNTIESEYSGVIKDIYVQDGEPIEYGQILFSIDTDNV